jgi:hypothetical protein
VNATPQAPCSRCGAKFPHECGREVIPHFRCTLCTSPAYRVDGVFRHANEPFEDASHACEKYGYPIAVTGWKVTITYFKPSGKYYTEDENVEWSPDATHYTGWAPFERVVRIKAMFAVCFNAPHGFPQMYVPQGAADAG